MSASEDLIPLPEDILEQILRDCSPLDLFRVSQSSRAFRRIATGSRLWEEHYYDFYRLHVDQFGLPRFAKARAHRQHRRAQRLRTWLARDRAEASCSPSDSTERYGEDELHCDIAKVLSLPANWSPSTAGHPPDFHELFVERINSDTAMLHDIRQHLALVSKVPSSAAAIAGRYGDGARDFLHALVYDQTLHEEDLVEAARLAPRSEPSSDDFPTAYEVHWRTVARKMPRPSRTHSLSLVDCASCLLSHLQRREAVATIRGLKHRSDAQQKPVDLKACVAWSSSLVEEGITAVAELRGDEPQELKDYLDLMAVYVFMRIRRQGSAAVNVAGASDTGSRSRMLCRSIMSVLAELGFGIAGPQQFLDIKNSFVSVAATCPAFRSTIPLSLVVVFCSIARRLGVTAALCDTPRKIIAVVIDDDIGSSTPLSAAGSQGSPHPIFFVDPSTEHIIQELPEAVQWTDAFGWRPEPDQSNSTRPHLQAALSTSIMMRCARNIQNAARNGTAWFDVLVAGSSNRADSNATAGKTDKSLLAEDRTIIRTLQDFLMSPPHTLHEEKNLLTDSLGPLQPLRRTTARTSLPPKRGASQGVEDESALFASCWVMMELSNDLGMPGCRWVLKQIGDHNILDALLLPGVSSVVTVPPSPSDDLAPMEEAGSPTEYSSDSEMESDGGDTGRRSSVFDLTRNPGRALWAEAEQPPDVRRRHTGLGESKPDADPVTYRVGTLFTHRRYGYRGVILAWDATCEASDAWQHQMRIDTLPHGGSQQPFYNVLADDTTSRYVAECNIVPLRTSAQSGGLLAQDVRPFAKLLRCRSLGKHFRCFSIEYDQCREEKDGARAIQARLLPTARTQFAWPDG
ncbi:unnamed protein product [Parajaminaea phylloscopi]